MARRPGVQAADRRGVAVPSKVRVSSVRCARPPPASLTSTRALANPLKPRAPTAKKKQLAGRAIATRTPPLPPKKTALSHGGGETGVKRAGLAAISLGCTPPPTGSKKKRRI